MNYAVEVMQTKPPHPANYAANGAVAPHLAQQHAIAAQRAAAEQAPAAVPSMGYLCLIFWLRMGCGIAFLVMGAIYKDDCIREPMIPIYLIGRKIPVKETDCFYLRRYDERSRNYQGCCCFACCKLK